MIRRFHIEDLIIQDASGVVFRALDAETGQSVAVRRFFPFGADGGGLQPDEQTAYDIAVKRLASVSHPALRGVVCGGCDPVDGMPFIATEWVDGDPLDIALGRGSLPPEATVLLLSQALEVCELLSAVLSEEAVWVETGIASIIVSRQNSGRGFTFWISPLKWLGTGENRGLESIIALAEDVLGWSGRLVNEQAGNGLGGWLKWLRDNADTATLQQAREMLASSVGAATPPPARELVAQAAARTRQSSAGLGRATPWTFGLAAAVLVIGVSGWFLARRPAAPAADAAPLADPVARANQRALELSRQAAGGLPPTPAFSASPSAAAATGAAAFTPDQVEELLGQTDSLVTVEGVLTKISYSGGGDWMYLVFAGDATTARGKIVVADAGAEMAEPALSPLIGKTIRITGIVEPQPAGPGRRRPLVAIHNRGAIETR